MKSYLHETFNYYTLFFILLLLPFFTIAQDNNNDIAKSETNISDNDFALALRDFKNGEARLYSQGGLSPVVGRKNLKKLYKKYKVMFYEMGCIGSSNLNELIEYNEAVFELLNFKYGTKWQTMVNPDTIGFKKWKKKQG